MLRRGLFAALLVTLIGCGGGDATTDCEVAAATECESPDDGGVQSPIVVDVAWLEEHLDDPDVQLVDTRSVGYETGRIPGAIRLRPEDLSTTIDGISSQIRPAAEAQPVLRAAGLRQAVTAVVYGVPLEYDSSRVVWSLRFYRHHDVRYLDGGYGAWVDAGGEIETITPSVTPTEYTVAGIDEDVRATGDWILARIGDAPYDMPAIGLVDARSRDEYERGHIPNALSIDWTRNLRGGLLLPRAELEALYEGLDPQTTTVTYCVTGWRGSFAWLTLTALGYEDVRLYDGSWAEWGRGEFPVEQ